MSLRMIPRKGALAGGKNCVLPTIKRSTGFSPEAASTRASANQLRGVGLYCSSTQTVAVDGLPISDHVSSLKMIVVETPATTINPRIVRIQPNCHRTLIVKDAKLFMSPTYLEVSMRQMCKLPPPHISIVHKMGGTTPDFRCFHRSSNRFEIMLSSILPLPAPVKVFCAWRNVFRRLTGYLACYPRVITVPAGKLHHTKRISG